MKKFEYYSENDLGEDDLNDAGKQGWELCAVAKAGQSNRFWFKRELNQVKTAREEQEELPAPVEEIKELLEVWEQRKEQLLVTPDFYRAMDKLSKKGI